MNVADQFVKIKPLILLFLRHHSIHFYNYASESDPPKYPYPTKDFKGYEMTNKTKNQVLDEATISWINFYDFAA